MENELPTTAPAAAGTSAAPIRVLVLDDEQVVRSMAQRALAESGCTVECVANGREGLHLLLQRQFDVLVVDLRMDGMDGPTFLREAQKIWPWLGVVIMSGYLTTAAREQLAPLNIHRFVEKPVALDVLIQEVQAEARDKRSQLRTTEQQATDRIQNQLAMLRTMGEMAIGSDSLLEALRGLGAGLGRLLPCSVVGILDLDQDDAILLLNCQEPVAEDYLTHLKSDMLRHFASLCGRTPTEAALRVQIEGEPRSPRGPAQPASVFAMPIIVGGELRGLLSLTSSKPEAFATTDIAFLYHAANQLSTVLVALNRARELAIRDSVTGLFNRRHLEEQLDHTLKFAERYGHTMGVALIDLDHFKKVNDTFGHLAGDQVLREFAELLKRVARTTDIVGRFGGDEFLVILSKLEPHAAAAFGERLLATVRQYVFCAQSLRLHLSCTIGTATSQQLPEASATEQLLQHTDTALYAAKHAGRNRVAVWSPELASQPATVAVATPTQSVPAAPTVKGRILIADDDELICRLVQRALTPHGYEVATAQSAAAARALFDAQAGLFDVALVDLQLGDDDGFELVDYMRGKDLYLAQIVITGHASLDNAVASLRHGVYDFVQKPFPPAHLLALVARALTFKQLRQENARYQLHLEDMVREKSAALSGALTEVKQSYEFTLEALAAMLDAREHATAQHSQRARKITLLLARELGLPPGELDDIGRGALLHDIGKTGIPDEILLNEKRLTPEQRQIIQRHPEIGYNIISATPFLAKAADIVLCHHERFDGTGYPRGLRGTAIPLGARIFSVVDSYDAMRSTRPYHQGCPPAVALAEIQKFSSTQFDPEVVAALIRCQAQIENAGEWSLNA